MGQHQAKKLWKTLGLVFVAILLVGGGLGLKQTVFAETGSSESSAKPKNTLAPHESETPATSKPTTDPSEKPSEKPSETAKPQPEVTFTVAATGDFLTHLGVSRAARQSDGTYSLAKLLDPIKPWIHGADLALCHQEIVFGKRGQTAGYPSFLMPAEMATDMVQLGYDGCSTASNHTWDHGVQGANRTLDTLEAAGLGAVGSRRVATETPWQMYELTKNGRTVKIAHLSMAYGINQGDLAVLRQNPWRVELANPETVVGYAREARAAGAEVVIVSVHTGIEYKTDPSPQQRQWAQFFAESGEVDLYLGHHAHVAQPIEKLPGGRGGQGMWVYYGLGNIMSSMTPSLGVATQLEELAWVTITVPGVHEVPLQIEAKYVSLALDPGVSKPFPMQPFLTGQRPDGARIASDTVRGYHQKLLGIVGNQAEELLPAAGVPQHGEPAVVKALPR